MEPIDRDSTFPPEFFRVTAVAATWSFAYATFYLLPKYLEQALGSPPATIGLVMGSFGWATVGMAPLATRAIARWSRRSVFALGSLAIAATSLGFLAADGSLPALVALRVAQAFAHALVFTAVSFAAAELAPPARLSQALGLCGASMLVMNALAPAALEPVADRYGWGVVFVLSAGVAVLASVLSLRLRGAAPYRASGTPPTGFIAVLRTPIGRDFAIIAAASGLAFGTVFAFEPSLALSLGRERVSGFFVGFAAGAISVRLGLGHLPDRLGRRAIALATFALYSVALFSLAIVPAGLLEVVGLVFGVAHGLFYPSLNGLVLAAVPPSSRAAVLTIFTAAFYLGFAGPTFLGTLVGVLGLRGIFAVAGAMTMLGVGLLAGSKALRAEGEKGDIPLFHEPPIALDATGAGKEECPLLSPKLTRSSGAT